MAIGFREVSRVSVFEKKLSLLVLLVENYPSSCVLNQTS